MVIIDEEDNKTWREIYEATHETYFKKVTLFTDELLK